MVISWVSIVPPLIVLFCAALTRKVLWSLALGILCSALLISDFSLQKTTLFLIERFREQLIDPLNIYTFGFLLLLGVLITLINMVGGASAYGTLIKKLLKTPRAAQFSSVILSLLFMIDDFFSSLTVGCIMRPLTDSFKIPRVKLAFLIDSLAAPLVIIMPISTWIAMILMQINKAGISLDPADKPVVLEDPFVAYLYVIPYVLYSFAILASVWFIVQKHISFGPMKTQEDIAHKTGNLFGKKAPILDQTTCPREGQLIDFALPILSLLVCIVLVVLYSGNSTFFGGTNGLLKTIQQADIFLSLLIGCALALVISLGYMFTTQKITVKTLPLLARGGFDIMYESILILFLAWTFSSILKDDLKTGTYLASIMVGAVPGFLLPAMFFLASLITACVTGSSWGTIAVMLPLAVPLVASFLNITTALSLTQVPLLIPAIGAIFSGAVAGDHVSPLGTTTIMSATSAGSYLDDHVLTQLPYALPALITTFIGFLLAGYLIAQQGYLITWLLSLALTILPTLALLYFMNYSAKGTLRN